MDANARLGERIAVLVTQYKMPKSEFYLRYERGELSDAMDYIEWSATAEMFENLGRRIELLSSDDRA